jgi:hypothetical protein
MPATVKIERVTGAAGGPTYTDITSGSGLGTTRLNTADAVTDGTANPTQIPASGTNYSYWANIRMVCTVAPSTGINHVQMYTSGSNPFFTNVGLNVSTVTGVNGANTNYVQASGTAGVTGLDIGSSYTGASSPANAFGYISSSPLSVLGQFVTGTDTAGAGVTGSFANWIVFQLVVPSTVTTTGVTSTAVITIVWDEF